MTVEENPRSMLAPPRFAIEGIGPVTEGAITLNQPYNVLDDDASAFREESAVTDLHALVKAPDRVNFLVDDAENPAANDVSFRQKGILARRAIIPLLARKLGEAGKLVVIEPVWMGVICHDMIPGGTDPVAPLPTTAAKIFACAVFSGLVFIAVMGIVLAPLVRRMLHRFHVQDNDTLE